MDTNLLFAANADDAGFRRLTYSVVVETAFIYARHIDVGGRESYAGLLSDLQDSLTRAGSADCIELFRGHPRIHDDEFGFRLAHIFDFLRSSVDMRKRYLQQILPRTLEPFAISLVCDDGRDAVIKTGMDALHGASEWHGQVRPVDQHAVQFFELVGFLGATPREARRTMLVDGEVERGLERGCQGLLGFDEGSPRHFGNLNELVQFLLR